MLCLDRSEASIEVFGPTRGQYSPVGMLRKGQGEVGELPVGDRLALAEEALDHRPSLATEQLDKRVVLVLTNQRLLFRMLTNQRRVLPGL